MKKLILSVSILFTVISVQAQNAEYNQIKSLANSNNKTQVVEQIESFESNDYEHSIEPQKQAEMYFIAGSVAQKAGDMITSAEYFSKVREIESNPYYAAKNKNTKKVEYFFDKAEADKVISQGKYGKLKQKNISPDYTSKFVDNLTMLANQSLKSANDAFSKQNYEVASDKFLETYYASKAIGNDNDLFKYYAAISYLQTDNKQKAADLFEQLIEDDFDGVRTQYLATEKSTGKEFSFEDKAARDTQVKIGLYDKPRTETTASMEEELFSNATYAYYQLENWEKGIAIAKKGLAKYPANKNMNDLISSMYFKSGNEDLFAQNLENKVKNNTATAIDYFNLARVETKDKEKAKAYYIKSIEMDPTFRDSYLNLSLSIIEDEKELVDLINNNLGSSAKEKKIYKESQAKRAALYQEALPYLEKAYELDKNDRTVIQILKNTYEATGDDDKYLEFKKLSESK